MKYLLLCLVTASNCTIAKEYSTALQVKEIDVGVYLHTSYKTIDGYGEVDSNGLVVVDGDQAFIIDTPWSESDTEKLLFWISEKGFQPKASISTHFHEDSTAGIQVLNSKSIPTYTSELTNELLISNGKPTAANVFDSSEFSMREGVVEVFYPGAGHTRDNLVVWLPKKKILFGGCLVRGLEWSGLGFTGDAFLGSWADSVKNIRSKYSEIEIIVPGHGEVGDMAILDHTIELAEKVSNKSMLPTAKASAY